MALASTVVGADGYILESSGGWIVPWLDRMDRHCTSLAE